MDEEEIPLDGDLKPKKIRSLTSPIEAYFTGQYIEINFRANLGTIALSIYDEAGNAVYQQSLTATNGQQLLIPVSDYDSGTYTIVFVDSQNRYLSGNFEI
jgi:hypothetical protein